MDSLTKIKEAIDPYVQGTVDLVGVLPTVTELVKKVAEVAAAPPPPQPSAAATAVKETLRGFFSLGIRVVDRLPVEDLGSAIKARLLGGTAKAPAPAPATPGLGGTPLASAPVPPAEEGPAAQVLPFKRPKQEEVIAKLLRLWEERPDLVDLAEVAIDEQLEQMDGQGDDT